MATPRVFELTQCGDPYNPYGYDVREYEGSPLNKDTLCIFRGDISPIQGWQAAKRKLKGMYPGCVVLTYSSSLGGR